MTIRISKRCFYVFRIRLDQNCLNLLDFHCYICNLKEVFLCFDNDEAGQNAAQRISDKLFLKGIKSRILIPNGKDWNEDLLTIRAAEDESEVAEPCQMSLS